MLRRNLWFCPKEVKTTAYTTLVRPIIEYASCAWDPYRQGSINKLERVQRKAARFCIGNYKRDSSVMSVRCWKTLNGIHWKQGGREWNWLAMLYKIQNSLVGINKESYVNVSSSAGLRKKPWPASGSSFWKEGCASVFLFPRTSKTWNNLGQQIISSPSYEVFKNQFNTGQGHQINKSAL